VRYGAWFARLRPFLRGREPDALAIASTVGRLTNDTYLNDETPAIDSFGRSTQDVYGRIDLEPRGGLGRALVEPRGLTAAAVVTANPNTAGAGGLLRRTSHP
jgi:hypothetical protein